MAKPFPAPCDFVIPFHKKDSPVFFTYTLPHLLKNALGLRTIFLITAKENLSLLSLQQSEKIQIVFEESFPFSLDDIAKICQNRGRTAWYYQQVLKLYAHRVLREKLLEEYVIWDSDTILLKPTPFFLNDIGEISGLFAISPEYNPPYMEHMERLLPEIRRLNYQWGGVTHHQPWKKKWVDTLLQRIEWRHGRPAWKAYLEKVEQKHWGGSGCADYEIMMAFTFTYFGSESTIRPLRWANRRELPSPNEDLDFVALHEHMMPLVLTSSA